MVSDSQRQRPRNPLVKHARNGSGKSIPHKRGAGGGGASNRKPKTTQKLSFHSTTCDSNNNSNKSGDLFSEFPKLDPSIPEQKRRLEQRRKMISYGKNTVGYDEYIKQVPKEKRRKRNMETPATPDHTLDIPNKRWMGQVRAWRRALHSYDPPDLQQSLASAATAMETEETINESVADTNNLSTREKELAQAREKGLLVDLGDAVANGSSNNKTAKASGTALFDGSPTSVVGVSKTQQAEMKELDEWEAAAGNDAVFCSDDDDDESDDDLL